MLMYTKHVPQTILWVCVILVVVPDGSASVRIVNFSMLIDNKAFIISFFMMKKDSKVFKPGNLHF